MVASTKKLLLKIFQLFATKRHPWPPEIVLSIKELCQIWNKAKQKNLLKLQLVTNETI